MKTTIDKAGRVVIPAAIRERAGFTAGTEIEVLADDISVRLIRSGPSPTLVMKGKRLVAKPRSSRSPEPRIDLARMIEDERNRWPW